MSNLLKIEDLIKLSLNKDPVNVKLPAWHLVSGIIVKQKRFKCNCCQNSLNTQFIRYIEMDCLEFLFP